MMMMMKGPRHQDHLETKTDTTSLHSTAMSHIQSSNNCDFVFTAVHTEL